jgi:Outer membrane protein beta-barrel domain
MTMRTTFASTALAAVLALAGPALAQNNANEPTVRRSLSQVPVAPSGMGLQLGGGVTGFTRQEARDRFGTGGYWDLRAVLGTESYLGAEVAYVGSSRGVTASGLSDNAALLGNGAEALVRANLPLQAGSLRLEPYLFGGAGWTYYQIIKSDSNSSGIKDHANAFVIPFGGGLSAVYDHFIIDARFTYRSVFDDKLVAAGNNDSLDLQNWSAGLTVGYEL